MNNTTGGKPELLRGDAGRERKECEEIYIVEVIGLLFKDTNLQINTTL